jgi:hypothetical protein
LFGKKTGVSSAGRSAASCWLLPLLAATNKSLALMNKSLTEVECKLNLMLEELRTPTAIGYSVRRGNLPRKD